MSPETLVTPLENTGIENGVVIVDSGPDENPAEFAARGQHEIREDGECVKSDGCKDPSTVQRFLASSGLSYFGSGKMRGGT
jgi:hypothetical protein